MEVDQAVRDYVRDHGDSCVQKMFSRFVKKDGTVAALFPFQQLQHSFIVGDHFGNTFNPEEERQSNEGMRSIIETMKERVTALVDWTDERAKRKGEHYIAFLNAQLEVCKETGELIDMWDSPFPRRRIGRK